VIKVVFVLTFILPIAPNLHKDLMRTSCGRGLENALEIQCLDFQRGRFESFFFRGPQIQHGAKPGFSFLRQAGFC